MADADYPVYLQALNKDLTFLLEKRVINRFTKLVCTFYNKKSMYVVQNYGLKHGLILKNASIKFKQKTWLELYISSNNYFRTIAKKYLISVFDKLIQRKRDGKRLHID